MYELARSLAEFAFFAFPQASRNRALSNAVHDSVIRPVTRSVELAATRKVFIQVTVQVVMT